MFSLEADQETSARELGRAVDAGNVEPELGGGPRVVIKQPKVDPEAFAVGGCRPCQTIELDCDQLRRPSLTH